MIYSLIILLFLFIAYWVLFLRNKKQTEQKILMN